MPSRCTVLAEQAVDLKHLMPMRCAKNRALDEKIKRGEALDEAIPVTEAKQLAETKLPPCFPQFIPLTRPYLLPNSDFVCGYFAKSP